MSFCNDLDLLIKQTWDPSNRLNSSLLVQRFGMDEGTFSWQTEESRLLPALTSQGRGRQMCWHALCQQQVEPEHVSAFE